MSIRHRKVYEFQDDRGFYEDRARTLAAAEFGPGYRYEVTHVTSGTVAVIVELVAIATVTKET